MIVWEIDSRQRYRFRLEWRKLTLYPINLHTGVNLARLAFLESRGCVYDSGTNLSWARVAQKLPDVRGQRDR